ncbi:MAG: hypothetical protein U9P10_03930 [Thermodesulfobacteriota bacterium]|nr:hypothetical protein [Thermodesulfobacteriota bacterium]
MKQNPNAYALMEQKVQERTSEIEAAAHEFESLFNSSQVGMMVLKGGRFFAKGIVPICAQCKSIRDDKGYWNKLEAYIEKHSDASFSHSVCPECAEKLYGHEDWYIKMKKDQNEQT